MIKNQNKRKTIILSVIFIGYLVFNGILLAGHELWRDEANVWLLARDVSPIELIKVIKYQGHPCLWYYLVMPFAKLGFPFPVISILSFLIMAVTAGLFVYMSSFHPITIAVCLFSPIFSYYYPVVARNYCLIALLLMLLAFLYPKRNQKPLLYGLLTGLLVQADTIAIPAAGLISCMWLWEGCVKRIFRTVIKGIWIPLFSVAFWCVQFAQVSDSPAYHMNIPSVGGMITEIRNFSYMILTRMTGQGQKFDLLLILLFMAAAVLLSAAARTIWPALVMAGGFLFEVIFSIMVYQLHIWHYICIPFMLIWGFWILYHRIDDNGKLLTAGKVIAEGMLILLGITMFLRWNAPEESSSLANAWNGIYSDGVNMADYIRENIDSEDMIVYTDVAYAATVQAYLDADYDFRYAGTLEKITYANYTEEQSKEIAYNELLAKVKKEFFKNSEKKGFYLLLCGQNCITDIIDEQKENWMVCYKTKETTARGEEYTLYFIPFAGGAK